jgi:hypothetical protein
VERLIIWLWDNPTAGLVVVGWIISIMHHHREIHFAEEVRDGLESRLSDLELQIQTIDCCRFPDADDEGF